jgi:hypothetical protein
MLFLINKKKIGSKKKISRMLLSVLRIPDSDPDFLAIPDPGVTKAPDHRSATLVTVPPLSNALYIFMLSGCSENLG